MGHFFRVDVHYVGLIALAALFSLPLIGIGYYALLPGGEYLEHIQNTLMPRYIHNTIILVVGVSIGTLLFGISAAWIMVHYNFFGKSLLNLLLLAPLAIPPYILSIVYFGLFDYGGTAQQWASMLFGEGVRLPPITNPVGASILLSVALYPYVYLLTRIAFKQHYSASLVARCFTKNTFRRIFTVSLPMARPAIIAGLTLVIMETVSEFGAMQLLAVDTLTTGIYRSWYSLGAPEIAARLSLVLIFIIIAVIACERALRGRAQYTMNVANPMRTLPTLRGSSAMFVWFICGLPVVFGFIIPVISLISMALTVTGNTVDATLGVFFNTVIVAGIAGATACGIALFQAYATRFHSERLIHGLVRSTSVGYAIPGAVLAVGVLATFGWIDNRIDGWLEAQFGISTGLIFSGTIFALVFAYVVRFLAIGLGAVESGLSSVTKELDWSAQLSGYSLFPRLRHIHLPLIRPSILVAFLLVTVESIKELPATLIIRPFNFETLATSTYLLASDERIVESSIPALVLISISMAIILLINGYLQRENH